MIHHVRVFRIFNQASWRRGISSTLTVLDATKTSEYRCQCAALQLEHDTVYLVGVGWEREGQHPRGDNSPQFTSIYSIGQQNALKHATTILQLCTAARRCSPVCSLSLLKSASALTISGGSLSQVGHWTIRLLLYGTILDKVCSGNRDKPVYRIMFALNNKSAQTEKS